jgi:hypothetical protein
MDRKREQYGCQLENVVKSMQVFQHGYASLTAALVVSHVQPPFLPGNSPARAMGSSVESIGGYTREFWMCAGGIGGRSLVC